VLRFRLILLLCRLMLHLPRRAGYGLAALFGQAAYIVNARARRVCEDNVRHALGPAADGFFGPSQWEPEVRHHPDVGPTSAQFVAHFRARFGAEPDYPAAQAYAAGLIAGRCVELAGTCDQGALLGMARSLALTTFYGGFRLDPATGRQVGHELVIVQWQGGERRIVWPPSVADARPGLPPSNRSVGLLQGPHTRRLAQPDELPPPP